MSRLRAAHTRPKPFHVHTVGIDDDLFRVYPTHFEVAALDFRDDKNTRRRVKVQSLVSLQQIGAARRAPNAAPPRLRSRCIRATAAASCAAQPPLPPN